MIDAHITKTDTVLTDTLVKNIVSSLAKGSDFVLSQRETDIKVSFTIRGEAVVKMGEDYTQVVSFKLPYDKLVAVLFSKLNGVTVKSVVREALESDLDVSAIKAEALDALKEFKGMAKQSCKGKLTSKGRTTLEFDADFCEYC